MNLRVLGQAALVGAALMMAQSAAAATFNFKSIAGGGAFTDTNSVAQTGGEADWDSIVGAGLGVLDTVSGISVIGSATNSDGTAEYAYFDNGAGLGACGNTGQCSPSNDDNVGAIGGSGNAGNGTSETLVLTFNQSVSISELVFAAEGHGAFTGSLTINGVDTAIAGGTLNTAGGLTGSVFTFGYIPVPAGTDPASTNEFYISAVTAGIDTNTTVGTVPVPAAGLLLLGALGGLGVMRRRRKAA